MVFQESSHAADSQAFCFLRSRRQFQQLQHPGVAQIAIEVDKLWVTVPQHILHLVDQTHYFLFQLSIEPGTVRQLYQFAAGRFQFS